MTTEVQETTNQATQASTPTKSEVEMRQDQIVHNLSIDGIREALLNEKESIQKGMDFYLRKLNAVENTLSLLAAGEKSASQENNG